MHYILSILVSATSEFIDMTINKGYFVPMLIQTNTAAKINELNFSRVYTFGLYSLLFKLLVSYDIFDQAESTAFDGNPANFYKNYVSNQMPRISLYQNKSIRHGQIVSRFKEFMVGSGILGNNTDFLRKLYEDLVKLQQGITEVDVEEDHRNDNSDVDK